MQQLHSDEEKKNRKLTTLMFRKLQFEENHKTARLD